MLEPTTTSNLYHRLGGYEVIAAFVDDLFQMLRSDPRFARFGMGRSLDSHHRARQLLVDQICNLSGGPCLYIGRDMKTSHAGLGITQEEWQINIEYSRQALLKNNVNEPEIRDLIALFERYKTDIVEGPVTTAQ